MLVNYQLETDATIPLVIEFNYSLALTWCFPGLARVAAAALRTVVPRSFTFVSVRADTVRNLFGLQLLLLQAHQK
jgi:hypothetical protein